MKILFATTMFFGLAGIAHAAPAPKVFKPKVKLKAKMMRAQNKNVRPAVKPATTKLPTKLRQPSRTRVETWTTGNGQGHTVLFLHGLGGEPDGLMIHGILRGLEREKVSATFKAPLLRDVQLDKRGRVLKESVQTMSEQLHHAREVLRNQPGKVVLFGHSFGAKAALILAKEFPDKVSSIIAIAPSVKMQHAYVKRIAGAEGIAPEMMNKALAQYHNKLRIEHRYAVADGKTNRAEELNNMIQYNKIIKDLAQYDEVAMETKVQVPTLVLHGAADPSVSVHHVRRFAENNQKVTLIEHANRGHHLEGADRHVSEKTYRDAAKSIGQFLKANPGQ